MDMEELQTFVVLAGCRNFTKTAELMHVVQSTVSNRIRSLEDYVGTTLVLRYKSGVHLTAEGEAFLAYASQILSLKQKSLYEIHVMNQFRDHLRVGCVRWMHDQWVREMLLNYQTHFPDISLHLDIEHSANMIPMLQQKLLDIAFLSYELNNSNVISVPFRSTRLLFVGSTSQFGHLKAGIDQAELASLPLIYSDIWDVYLEELSKNVLGRRMVFQVHSNMLDSAKAFCLAGAGCCFLPEAMLEPELSQGSLIQIPIHSLPVHTINTYIAFQRQRLDSESLKSWLSLFKIQI